MKRLFLCLFLGLVAGVICALLYERYYNYDQLFFFRVAEVSDDWAARLRQQEPEKPCYVLAGGSESRMGVDPGVMQEAMQVRLINASSAAGHGIRANVVAALPYLRPGDTLVLSVIDIHSINHAVTTSGVKFCFCRQGFGAFSSGIVPLTAKNLLSPFKGSIEPLAITFARLTRPYENRYRYHSQTIVHPSGWVEVQHRAKLPVWYDPQKLRLLTIVPPEKLKGFADIRQYCRERGVDMVVHFPVGLTEAPLRAKTAFAALSLVRAGIPVLRDERLGVIEDFTCFADTYLHLTGAAARENSLLLARALKEKRYWTQEELICALRNMGWQEPLPEPVAMPH